MASGSVVNLFMVYQFLKRLVTPFNQWEAYREGVIDERGNILIRSKDRHTLDQKRSFGKFDLLVLRLKKLLEKLPGGKSRLASYAAALMLIKEDWNKYSEEEIEQLNIEQSYSTIMEQLEEEGIANVAGAGEVAGMGYKGPDDLKVSKRAATKYKRRNRVNKAFEDYGHNESARTSN